MTARAVAPTSENILFPRAVDAFLEAFGDCGQWNRTADGLRAALAVYEDAGWALQTKDDDAGEHRPTVNPPDAFVFCRRCGEDWPCTVAARWPGKTAGEP